MWYELCAQLASNIADFVSTSLFAWIADFFTVLFG